METTEQPSQPSISAEWSLDPTTHSFSSDTSPTLTLSLTNHANRPITIYNEYLIPSQVLAEGHFVIFDHTTNKVVDQLKTRFCDFPPPSKIHVPLRDHMFHTLYPGRPVSFTAMFGRSSKSPPRPRLEEQQRQARGVDGLEIGHEYSLRPGEGWGYIRWWEYGEKDEVISPPSGKLDGREIAYKRTKTPHPGIRVNVEALAEIRFRCVEKLQYGVSISSSSR
ncbi:MAG: hypothetical protein L6R38_008849 [Xanthoria sp. 2 TBL-2021]|nr:MAG: hypothetical protein L6R38_008849 [Xanthoria sp. 2 TBL-2021]